MKKLILFFISLMLVTDIFAQAPESFTYQAIVRDNLGNPLGDTSVTLQFNILQGSATGTTVYSENKVTTTNGFGLINLQIGQGTVNSGNFSTINWGNNLYFLNILLDQGSGFVDIGTQQFISVPYAMYAKSSGGISAAGNTGNVQFNDGSSLGANPDFHWDNAGEQLGIGITNPNGRLVIQQDANANDTVPILEVKNKLGQTIFVVYPDSVHIFIDDDNTKGVLKGGFAVSGRSGTKAVTNDFLLVRPDSTRIWTRDTMAGFGVRNIGSGYENSYLQLTPNNYFIGHDAGVNNTTGLYNTFIGFESGVENTVGEENIFLGFESGWSNISGFDNVFLGNGSGYTNSTGHENVFIGNWSGYSNDTGVYNVFIGNNTGHANTIGSSNVFIGDAVGEGNTTGDGNVFIGDWAAANNTDGSYNICLGNNAGWSNTIGNFNIFLGDESGYSNLNGNDNVFIGDGSGHANTSGNNNLFFGSETGISNTTGNYNIFLGSEAGYSNISGVENIFLGQEAGWSNTNGNGNLFLGSYSGYLNASGIYNTFIGYEAGYNTLGDSNVFIGYNAGANEIGSNKLYIENSDDSAPLIYGDFSTDEVQINGDLCYTGTFSACSDKRYKKNLKPISNVLFNLKNINSYYYNWKIKEFPNMAFTNRKQIGVIAQDIEKYYPELVKTDANGYKSVDYSKLSVVLLEAIKEQQQLIDELRNSNSALMTKNQNNKSLIESQNARITKIENLLDYSVKK
ncbi:MAG: hypothetical protein DRP35_06775 [Candidatus Zixiibacteriota bacterium]|nr:MAG: hypothetical protein DRP35_06775 [candidate division Zixibacteria bacterium]